MNETTDVAIIGAGIIGCAIAYYLRKMNIAVTVLERGKIGAQASSAAAGLLAPLGPISGPGPFADLLLSGFKRFIDLIPELEEVSSVHVGYEQTGALRTVRNPKRVAHLQKRMEAWQPLGLKMHWLTGDEARKLEPQLDATIQAAVYAPEESQVQAPHVVQAYYQAAQRLGATFCPYEEVIGLRYQEYQLTHVLTTQRAISCQYLIITAGSWAAQCGDWLHLHIPVTPLKGEMLSYQQPSPPLRHILFGEGAYLAPKGEHLIVGATKAEAGFDTLVTERGISWLQHTASKLLTGLDKSSYQSAWAGLRPKTPDTRPILGPAPQWNNVLLATGHNSVGIILSAITGQVIAETISTGQTPQIIKPFSLERFTS